MPRDLPLGNGKLLLNFDKSYNLRDIYWPHVGQSLHTAGDVSHSGVWVKGQFAWFDAPEWEREMQYDDETLSTAVTLKHPGLQLQLVFHDSVDFDRNIFLRYAVVTNLANEEREVRLFFHYDWHIWGDAEGNTVFYYPYQQALIAYKLQAYFLLSGQIKVGEQVSTGISSWATGVKEFHGAEGTWRDAEDGELGRNPIAQGSVDGTIALHVPSLAAGSSGEVYHWLAVGSDLTAVVSLDDLLRKRGPETFLKRTRNYWHLWVNKDEEDFCGLAPELIEQYKRSLLILRTQIDHDGAIIAANDATMRQLSEDSYSYMWPRDGALVANALSHAGYSEITRSFYDFCNCVLTEGGYLLHKYNPDRSWGSSWESWVAKDGTPQLPIQEDETALVIYSLWQHYICFHDIEFVAPHFRSLVTPAADFLASYREPHTRLPDASYDLWEERRGILSYTTATVYAGLNAAANFSHIFGEEELAATYRQAANEIKEAALQHLWDEERGHFLRMITIDKAGNITRDTTLDSSLCGLFQFGMLAANDPRMERTMQALEQTLWAKTAVGGMARYEDDYYYQVTHDLNQAQGNPWFICTLWLAQYRIAHATTLNELQQAIPLLSWAHTHALPSGVMAEQINPFTGEPLSVSPLTWSHAEYVMTVRWYVGKHRKLQAI
ncbi:glycoside hydrolase family 15 protein [Ktedonosporobacter rubrisoli]|uniref:Glycoside hydrolase family 15 protein n=1 Tax=Ktedonosporobacter rubrisoli TaxID=2509675 RepID=A0A4P6JV70_KTERU|nr:glycoside hydrolase family 15 protein [Ktedonosporobacter rubrisoli]QBD79230.1 glycoside hydrolase family 15 protein [Ktedonosporobacter rubrisoli]